MRLLLVPFAWDMGKLRRSFSMLLGTQTLGSSLCRFRSAAVGVTTAGAGGHHCVRSVAAGRSTHVGSAAGRGLLGVVGLESDSMSQGRFLLVLVTPPSEM